MTGAKKMNLDSLKRFERETVITEFFAVTVERTGRGSYATVTDTGSEFNGESVFASIPSVAFALLLDKVGQLETKSRNA
jgi:hypothetical protein